MRFALSRATVLPGKLLRIPAALSPLARSAASVEPPERTLSEVLLLVRRANVSDVVLDAALRVAGRVDVLGLSGVVGVDCLPAKVTVGLVLRSLVVQRMSGMPVRVVVRVVGGFAVVVGCFVTLESVVRSVVFEVRSSESRDNLTRSEVPLRADIEVMLLERVVEFELRVVLNRELGLVIELVLVLDPVAMVLVGRL